MLHLVFIGHCNFPSVIGHINTCDLNIVVTNSRNNLDTMKVVGEDDDVAAGGIHDERDPLNRANTERLVSDIASTSQYLMTLHCFCFSLKL